MSYFKKHSDNEASDLDITDDKGARLGTTVWKDTSDGVVATIGSYLAQDERTIETAHPVSISREAAIALRDFLSEALNK